MLVLHAAIAVAAVLASARGASAHPLDLGYLRIQERGAEVAVTLDLDVRAAALLLGAESLDAQAVAARATALADASFAQAPIATDAGPCRWGPASAELRGRTVTIASAATCTGHGARRWSLRFVQDQRISSAFQLMVKESVDGSERLTMLDRGRASIELAGA